MTQDQVMSLVRQIIPFLGGIAVGKGWLTTAQLADLTNLSLQIAGPLFLIVGSILAFIANSKKSIVASATNMPEVDSKKFAASISDPALKEVAATPTPTQGS